jgi:hypothetical protein
MRNLQTSMEKMERTPAMWDADQKERNLPLGSSAIMTEARKHSRICMIKRKVILT